MVQVVTKASQIKLDDQQLAAVEADPNRPALVLAGAGSGKTRTLTLRVAHLIELGADPGKIVATTFSRKAADEMKERLAPIVGRDVEKLMVNTIHGLCRFMLIDEGLAYDVITVSEQRKIIEDALSPKHVNWDCGWHYPLYWIRRMKMDLVDPMKSEGALRRELYGCCAKWQAEDLARKLASVYRIYEQDKEAMCVVRGTKILCPREEPRSSRFYKKQVPVEEIRAGDLVVVGTGAGCIGTRMVRAVKTEVQKAKFVEVVLESGKRLKMTANHVVFARGDRETGRIGKNFVYLENRGKHWRIGWSQNPFARRSLSGDAECMVVIGQYDSKWEALFWEDFLSAKYGIPEQKFDTTAQPMPQEWVDKLYAELDTESRARELARDLQIDLSLLSTCKQADKRIGRSCVYFDLCFRHGQHQVSIWVPSRTKLVDDLVALGMSVAHNGNGGYKLSKVTADYDAQMRLVEQIVARTGARPVFGSLIAGKMRMMSAGTLHKGMLMPVAEEVGHKVKVERIVEVIRTEEEQETYDLEVDGAANFVANGVVVHNSRMDFDDMLMWVGRKLRDNAQFRQKWQDRVDYVLVDELQDTSRLSVQILETLAAPENRIFGVGDGAQAIYRWNMADPQHNVFGFVGRLGGDLYKIETNYRSTQRIVEVGNKLSTILFPEGQVDFKKELKPRPGAGVGEEVEVVRHDDPYAEAAWVGDTIQSEGFKPGDVYVVYRLNAQSRVIEDELVTRGIPYIVQGSLGFYDRAVIKDVLSYLRLVENENNDDAFRRVANMASVWHKKHYRGFGQAFYRDCTILGKSLWQGMLEISRKVPQFKRDGIDDLVTLIESLRHEGDHKAAKTIKLIREYCYDEWLRRKEGVAEGDEDTQAFEDLNELQDAALSFKTNKEMLAHVDAILAMKEQQKKDQEIDCVVLSTIHRVKGLERPVVFGIGIVDGVLPHWRSDPSIFPDLSGRDELPVQNTSSVDEERCGAYVLVTRAKERLFLGVPMEWRGRAVMPSRFLAEMGLKAEKVEQMPEKPCQDGSIAVETVAEVDPQLVEPDEPAEEF